MCERHSSDVGVPSNHKRIWLSWKKYFKGAFYIIRAITCTLKWNEIKFTNVIFYIPVSLLSGILFWASSALGISLTCHHLNLNLNFNIYKTNLKIKRPKNLWNLTYKTKSISVNKTPLQKTIIFIIISYKRIHQITKISTNKCYWYNMTIHGPAIKFHIITKSKEQNMCQYILAVLHSLIESYTFEKCLSLNKKLRASFKAHVTR